MTIAKSNISTKPARARLVTRLWTTAERQVAEVELRLKAIDDDPIALEREAKTLAIITRTVRDLVAIDAERKPAAKDKIKDVQNAADPRSLDEFRASLAARLAELGGGGNNVKHGDLEMAMFDGDRNLDVHMGTDGPDMACVDCHQAANHRNDGAFAHRKDEA